MADKLDKKARSLNMSKIKSKDTLPEILVRKKLHSLGFRFRLHKKELPGKPDIVLPKYQTVIFINGCFWHRHENCIEASKPKTNSDYWENKINNNIERDKKNYILLEQNGWNVVILWECEIIKNKNSLNDLLINLLS